MGGSLWLLGGNLSEAQVLPHIASASPGWIQVTDIINAPSPQNKMYNFGITSISTRIYIAGGNTGQVRSDTCTSTC